MVGVAFMVWWSRLIAVGIPAGAVLVLIALAVRAAGTYLSRSGDGTS